MKGAIVYNGFWNREGPSDPVQRLQKAAAERGIPLAALPNTALTAMFGPGWTGGVGPARGQFCAVLGQGCAAGQDDGSLRGAGL